MIAFFCVIYQFCSSSKGYSNSDTMIDPSAQTHNARSRGTPNPESFSRRATCRVGWTTACSLVKSLTRCSGLGKNLTRGCPEMVRIVARRGRRNSRFLFLCALALGSSPLQGAHHVADHDLGAQIQVSLDKILHCNARPL